MLESPLASAQPRSRAKNSQFAKASTPAPNCHEAIPSSETTTQALDTAPAAPMALNNPRPAMRLASQALRSCTARPNVARPLSVIPSISRAITTTPSRKNEDDTFSSPSQTEEELPRWAKTPERMRSPFSPHITKNPANSRWIVNSSPAKLDEALVNFLGIGGDRLLPEELKWLAVTHKSFDQGRRGFNDRLAFLGRQLARVEAMESILTSAQATATAEKEGIANDVWTEREKREPFEPPELKIADNLSYEQPDSVLPMDRMLALAQETGLMRIVRWKPRKVSGGDASELQSREGY
jgi:large subunit ribosomal protein L15